MKYRADIEDAEDRGLARGRAETTIEMIRKLLARGYPLNDISDISGMSLDYIQNLSL